MSTIDTIAAREPGTTGDQDRKFQELMEGHAAAACTLREDGALHALIDGAREVVIAPDGEVLADTHLPADA